MRDLGSPAEYSRETAPLAAVRRGHTIHVRSRHYSTSSPDGETMASLANDQDLWPRLPLAEWQDTHDTLHMWLQIVGKTRLALSPKQNHWWHVPLYVSARGLTTTPIPYGSRSFEVEFDFIDHRLVVETSDGAIRETALRPQAVADFYQEYMGTLATLGIVVKLWPVPVEIENPIP